MRLRALFLIPARRGISGASIAILNIAKGLAQLGVEAHVVATKPPPQHEFLLRRASDLGVHVHIEPRGPPSILYWLFLALLALKHVAKLKPHVVHPHTPRTAILLFPVSLLARSLRVLTVEGDPVFESMRLRRLARLLAILLWSAARKWAQALIPCSQWLAKVLAHRHPELSSKIKAAPNPIDYERFAEINASKAKEELGLRGPTVFTAARLDWVKGVDVLIRAAANIASTGIKAYFLVAGDGPMKDELKTLSRMLGVEHLVKFLGFRGDVDVLTAACDVAVLPSRYEPFGMPAAEAGACGKPVVASAVGGLREIVVDGVTGILVKPGDHEGLASAIQSLLLEPRLRAKLGQAGKLRVAKHYTPTAVAKQVLETYLDVIKHRREPR